VFILRKLPRFFYKRETIRNNTFAHVLIISTHVCRKTVKVFLHFNSLHLPLPSEK
jgi:hypothetical protein